ncbi:hypothetical protein CR513_13823, partial [Mucuna pruriens]
MSVTRNQAASSTNEKEEDTLQQLLQKEAKERHKLAEERYKETLKIAKECEEELRRQLATAKATGEKLAVSTPSPAVGSPTFWAQPFSEEIDQTLIPQNFREVITKPFNGS